MKRIFFKSFLCLLFLMTGAVANAYDCKVDGLYYDLSGDNTACVVKGDNSISGSVHVNIPAVITYNGTDYSVTSIGDRAFENPKSLLSIIIPYSIAKIEDMAFAGCENLERAEFSSISHLCEGINFINITSNPLYCAHHLYIDGNEVTDIHISPMVSTIRANAFAGCSNVKSVSIPEGLTKIEDGAFYKCTGLTSVTIPSSVMKIGQETFAYCNNLTSIKVKSGLYYDSRNGCNAIIATNSNKLIQGCAGTVIPNTVESIALGAFAGTGIKEINIPGSVTSIGEYAFYDCHDLTSVIIQNGVTEIGKCAFELCYNLIFVKLPNSLTNIKYGTFANDYSLKSITIPNGVKKLGDHSFYCCESLTSVSLPNSITELERSVFGLCISLNNITIPNSVTTIGKYAFSGCADLTSVTIPNSVTTIDRSAFAYCSNLESITIPNSVTSIGHGAFAACYGLTSVTIPSGVTAIGEKAFYGCIGLQNVYSQIETPFEIDELAFDISDIVSSFEFYGYNGSDSGEFITYDIFLNNYVEIDNPNHIYETATLYVPVGTKEAYRSAPGWNRFDKIEEYDFTTAVGGIITNNDVKPKDHFSIDGTQLDHPQRGINIIRMNDGTTRKVVVK